MTAPILITGGAQRLGLAIADDLLLKNQPVIVTYRSKKPSLDILNEKGAILIQANFAHADGIAKFIGALKEETDRLRGIIHNASDWAKEKPDSDYNALLLNMMNVHVNAPYQINLACQNMLENNGNFADIIHMTDFVQEKGSQKHIAYAASKAALHNLTLSFSALLAPKVKVNSIAPALLMFNEWDDQNYRQRALKKSLLQNCPGAKEAVNAVNFILNSDYVTGQVLHLNGGRHLK
ncbi:dihydromonapterin reductase [Agaribacter flavus]|uniref:Dihydromonapterin reductase n=1 Tax=Agaribacter flavus TaxID=1902781 RepID=A0ABV7FPP5_9ALTE